MITKNIYKKFKYFKINTTTKYKEYWGLEIGFSSLFIFDIIVHI